MYDNGSSITGVVAATLSPIRRQACQYERSAGTAATEDQPLHLLQVIPLEPPTTKQPPILSRRQSRLSLEQTSERCRIFVAYLLTNRFDIEIRRLKDLLGFLYANSMNVVHWGVTGCTTEPARKGGWCKA